MIFEATQHPESVVILPAVVISLATCNDEACDATHWQFSLSFLIWTLEVTF